MDLEIGNEPANTGITKVRPPLPTTYLTADNLEQELKELITLKDLWPASTVTSQQLTAYHMILKSVNVTMEERRQALQALSLTKNFFPSVKEIFDMVLLIRAKKGKQTKHLTASEAWQKVVSQINNPKEKSYPNLETQMTIKAMGGWKIFDGEEPLQVIFAHFKGTYEEICDSVKTNSILDLILNNQEPGTGEGA